MHFNYNNSTIQYSKIITAFQQEKRRMRKEKRIIRRVVIFVEEYCHLFSRIYFFQAMLCFLFFCFAVVQLTQIHSFSPSFISFSSKFSRFSNVVFIKGFFPSFCGNGDSRVLYFWKNGEIVFCIHFLWVHVFYITVFLIFVLLITLFCILKLNKKTNSKI